MRTILSALLFVGVTGAATAQTGGGGGGGNSGGGSTSSPSTAPRSTSPWRGFSFYGAPRSGGISTGPQSSWGARC